MSAETDARTLIDRLLAGPAAFLEEAGSHTLLQTFFQGAPTELLVPLFSYRDDDVVQAATFVAAELGSAGAPLLDLVIPNLGRRYWISLNSYEVIVVNAVGSKADRYVHVLRGLEDAQPSLLPGLMGMVANASSEQLVAARESMDVAESESHGLGIAALLAGGHSLAGPSGGLEETELGRRYGAIAALLREDTDHLQRLTSGSDTVL